MAESDKKQPGDGRDNPGNAAKQAANAAKEIGKNAGKQAAAKGTEAVANAAASSVKAGVAAGKAISGIAAGAAAGGVWGAIIAAAWSMRHTLFKVLICICLSIVFLVVLIVSLPSIIFESLFDFGESGGTQDVYAVYAQLTQRVDGCIFEGYTCAKERTEKIISDEKYDAELSAAALVDGAEDSLGFNAGYILAAYSASMEQRDTDINDLVLKLENYKAEMFPVTYEEKETEDEDGDTVLYVACTIHPFDTEIIWKAFDIDPNAQYGDYDATYAEVIQTMAGALSGTFDEK